MSMPRHLSHLAYTKSFRLDRHQSPQAPGEWRSNIRQD
jgi:hypothetical protein